MIKTQTPKSIDMKTINLVRAAFMVMLFCVLASANSSAQSNDPPLMPVPNTPVPETEVKLQALQEQLTILQNTMNDPAITV